jgi:hypothetical protein
MYGVLRPSAKAALGPPAWNAKAMGQLPRQLGGISYYYVAAETLNL